MNTIKQYYLVINTKGESIIRTKEQIVAHGSAAVINKLWKSLVKWNV